MKQIIKKKKTIFPGTMLCFLIFGMNNNGHAQSVYDLPTGPELSISKGQSERDFSDDAADSTKGFPSFGAFPVLFSSEQTGFAGGGGAQITFKKPKDQKASALSLLAFYTQKKQYVFQVGSENYLKTGNYKLTGEFGFAYFPDTFYGIGNRIKTEQDEEGYTVRQFQIKPTLQKKYIENLYLGFLFGFYNSELTERDTSTRKLLHNEIVIGSKGGTVSGAGIIATWDSRDDNLYPNRGSYHQFSFISNGPSLGSGYTFNAMLMDLRHYRSITEGQILAFRGVVGINTGKTPFQMMNKLGAYLRGYTVMRFLDNNVIAFQAEYRRPLVWKLGMVAFIGFGEVADKVGNYSFKGLKPAVGFGIRIPLVPKQKVNLRIDLGIGKNDGSFDINIMEVF